MTALRSLDESAVLWLNSLLGNTVFNQVVLYVALYAVYAIPVIWLGWWFFTSQKQRFVLLSSLFSGVLAWQGLNRIAKLFYFHQRPSHDLSVKELLFERPENSFPSDHTAFLAGIAFFFLLKKQKKSGLWLLGLAILVGLARITVAVHYPSDILAGFLNGFIAAYLTTVMHGWLTDTIWTHVLTLARKLRLA